MTPGDRCADVVHDAFEDVVSKNVEESSFCGRIDLFLACPININIKLGLLVILSRSQCSGQGVKAPHQDQAAVETRDANVMISNV